MGFKKIDVTGEFIVKGNLEVFLKKGEKWQDKVNAKDFVLRVDNFEKLGNAYKVIGKDSDGFEEIIEEAPSAQEDTQKSYSNSRKSRS